MKISFRIRNTQYIIEVYGLFVRLTTIVTETTIVREKKR